MGLKAAMVAVWGMGESVRYSDLLLDLCRVLVPATTGDDGEAKVRVGAYAVVLSGCRPGCRA